MSKSRLNIEMASETLKLLDALISRRPGQNRTSMIAMVIHDTFDALPTAARKEIEEMWKREARMANPFTREGAAAIGIDIDKVTAAYDGGHASINALSPPEREWLDKFMATAKIVE